MLSAILAPAGLDLDAFRRRPLHRRIAACLRVLAVATTEAAVERITREPWLAPPLVDTLLNATTAMFRDADVFQIIRDQVLPCLRRRREAQVLSLGCSDGAELVSLALLAGRENIPARFVGVDCRPAAVAAARAGVYRLERLGSVTPTYRDLIDTSGTNWRLIDRLRATMSFRTANILELPLELAAGGWDLVLCRNVAIYLRPAAAAQLWRTCTDALLPGGYLVAGRTERVGQPAGLTRCGPGVYRREGL